jgi:ABC-type transport system involved in cytochrome c biogenesis permease subunit
MIAAYQANKADDFNKAIEDFRKHQGHLPSWADRTTWFEASFNSFSPFHVCYGLYIVAFVLACGAWIGYPDILNRSAVWLATMTMVLHGLALLGRMYIQGRPPVTNLYSSAVFIGWGSVVLGLFLERVYRNGIGVAMACLLGAATSMIANYLAESKGDTLEMMQAVLDTQFWLATHVTCITLGYSATFFAGFLGMLFIFLGVCTNRLDQDMFRSLGQMIYGVLCFATLLSFVGTVLGGIWADQSWGRFWGWDPKENGALLIVLINALILHARWAGLVKQRGMAVLTVVGNMVTGWSWFGTNQLGVGLHAYGFNNTLAAGLTIFWISQIFFIGLGLLPTQNWRSFGRANPDAPPASPRRKDRRGGGGIVATS